jgi:glycolate oxidase
MHLWKMRRSVAEAVKSNSIYKEEDTVVPRYMLPEIIRQELKRIGAKYGFKSVCYGHAGDGNLHVNIIKADMTDDNWQTQVPVGIREIFELTVSLKGTLSGETWYWLCSKKTIMDIAFSRSHLELMESIKRVFDPNNILNPGKIFPDHLT